ncbi:MAG TPA: substrate-binding domain-containing protein [Aestuariivirgaceae bacterium]|nr:substrate-binding domain-containing protein [Aestuariivirgaceae bacterium]
MKFLQLVRRAKSARALPVIAAIAAVGFLAVALAACGGGGSSSSSGSKSGGSTDMKKVNEELAVLFKGTYSQPPSSGPKPEAGKKIWMLSCGQSIITCAKVIEGASTAAKMIGWEPTVFDTKSNPDQAASAVRQAIAAGADGIFIMALDCDLFKQPLEEAKRAGLMVMAAESYDCSQNHANQPSLFDGEVTYPAGNYAHFIYEIGADQATWVISKLEGEGEVINFGDEEIAAVKRYQEGFEHGMEACGGCTVHEVPFKFADIGTNIQQKTEQALLKYPNAEALQVPTEAAITGGVLTAMQSAGRTEMFLTGYEGLSAATMDEVREGEGRKSGIGVALEWEGFAGVDGLNRLFHGEKPVSSGIGAQLFDGENNAGTSGPWQVPIEFRPVYEKSWGLG